MISKLPIIFRSCIHSHTWIPQFRLNWNASRPPCWINFHPSWTTKLKSMTSGHGGHAFFSALVFLLFYGYLWMCRTSFIIPNINSCGYDLLNAVEDGSTTFYVHIATKESGTAWLSQLSYLLLFVVSSRLHQPSCSRARSSSRYNYLHGCRLESWSESFISSICCKHNEGFIVRRSIWRL